MIASKYYNDPELHWIILLFNDILDPFYDWPMAFYQFENFIADKYGSASLAKSTTHHYEKTIATTDGYTNETTKHTYVLDANSYNTVIPQKVTKTFSNGQTVTVETTKRIVDCYTYEDELNESKRTIKLIKSDLVSDIKRQFEYLMSA
jgi:uncharacterized Fe-S cluster-containing radical SAM superfamily enzyme